MVNPASHNMFAQPSQAVLEHVQQLTEQGFRETDMQFNLSWAEGGVRNGYDVIHPVSKDRLFITSGSDADSEAIVSGVLGKHSTLAVRQRQEDFTVYDVPYGSRLLLKTLRAAPYREDYMDKLLGRAREMVGGLLALDQDAFGLTLANIALTHNGESERDGMHLTVVPPLASPLNERVTAEGVRAFVADKRKDKAQKAGLFALGKTVLDLQRALDTLEPRQPEFDRAKYLQNHLSQRSNTGKNSADTVGKVS